MIDVIIIHVSDLIVLADGIAYVLWHFLLCWQMLQPTLLYHL